MYFKEFGGISVFPLVKLNLTFASYFIDSLGQVYSSKRGSLQKLQGQRDSFNVRIWTLSTGRFPTRENGNALLARARAHKDWSIDTGTKAEPAIEISPSTKGDRHHAKSIEEGLKKNGSIIGRLHKGHLVFGSEPKIHTTPDSVKSEMIRLAASYPGTKFVQLQVVASVVAGGVVWE